MHACWWHQLFHMEIFLCGFSSLHMPVIVGLSIAVYSTAYMQGTFTIKRENPGHPQNVIASCFLLEFSLNSSITFWVILSTGPTDKYKKLSYHTDTMCQSVVLHSSNRQDSWLAIWPAQCLLASRAHGLALVHVQSISPLLIFTALILCNAPNEGSLKIYIPCLVSINQSPRLQSSADCLMMSSVVSTQYTSETDIT